jgi:hypothetical protein
MMRRHSTVARVAMCFAWDDAMAGYIRQSAPLLECPFCGDKARLIEYHGSGSDRWSAECRNTRCFVQPVTQRDTKHRVVAMWNSRNGRYLNIDAV